MKKKNILILFIVIILAVAAFFIYKNTSEPSAPPKIEEEQQEPSSKPKPEEPAPVVQIKESDALQLISEKVDTDKFEITLYNENVTQNEENYYIFTVSEDGIAFEPFLAVNKESGELSLYTEDGTFTPYDNRFSKNTNPQISYDWNGIFTDENTNHTVTLAQGDSTSFEFTFQSGESQFFGVARFSNATATYDDGNGTTVIFERKEDTLTVTSTNTQISWDGEYRLQG